MKLTGLFVNANEKREVDAAAVIFAEGDEGAEMFGIVEGAVELSAHGRVIAKLGPDETFGEMALVDSSPRMATATAVEPTVLAVIDRRHFLFLVHETPTFALQVMSSMAERLRHDA
jgi:CRP/FNR family transcriptional regulator, cyclic AMP receptor protein